jgi:SecD/SecF fusion protein
MRNLVFKIVFIVIVLALCAVAIFPPQERIRLGKDLRGGVSLIYSVDVRDAADPQEVLRQTIEVLQDRINPQGVLDISMEPVGNDRIEVIMPLPSPEVRALREVYEDALDALLAEAQITGGRLNAALRDGRAPAVYGDDTTTTRGRLIVELQETHDELHQARVALETAFAEGDDDERIAVLEQEVADLTLLFERLRRQVLDLSLDRARILRVLGLPTTGDFVRDAEGNRVRDPDTREYQRMPGQRTLELNAIKQDFPHLTDTLEQTVAAYDAYQAQRTALDDPEDLKRLLRGAGVLEFRIAVRTGSDDVPIDDLRAQLLEFGPENVDSQLAQWFEINDLQQWYNTPEELEFLRANPAAFFAGRNLVAEEFDGRYYLLLYVAPARSMTHGGDVSWSIRSASRGIDRQGRPAVDFRLDRTGGMLMARLTSPHVGEAMAIVLDGQVFSAPVLQSQIASRGQITGNFSSEELNYLIRVLAAGALEARLSEQPIAESTLGPSIGADNLRRGLDAFVIATIAIAIFMMVYYFFAGFVAVLALLANGLIIFGVMSYMKGTFTLPGLAGIVLTIGMAVDANVLIYERIREEMFAGELDLRGCIRQGYNKALSTILDANITNLIVCFVLFYTATTEVRGFALTLTIGICATLFTCLFVTRVIYEVYTHVFNARSLPMLPTAVPAIHHFLEPNINWIGLRKVFWTFSAAAIVVSLGLVSTRGIDMIDTELRGGVAVTFRTAALDEADAQGAARRDDDRIWLRHVGSGSVEERVRNIGQRAPEIAPDDPIQQSILREFMNASVLTVGRSRTSDQGFVEAQSFQIKVPIPRGVPDEVTSDNFIIDAVVDEFGDQLDVTPPLVFAGEHTADHTEFVVPIEREILGQNPRIDAALTQAVPDFVGGVAVMIREINPPVTIEDAERRINRLRAQPDYAATLGRNVEFIGMTPVDTVRGMDRYSSLIMLVHDPSIRAVRGMADPGLQELARSEWALVRDALTQRTALEQVASYSAAVARSLMASAQVAILLALAGILVYIWVRFGSLRYSLAAIVALTHDVIIALGVLALSAYLGRTVFGSMLLIEEFRIDLGVVAALLTIIGYSLNDTIVILDRIRENRGKLPVPNAATVNRSINQTVSRTVLTSTTTLMAIVIMYIAGGSGIRSFAFVLLAGLIIGTYSSVAIAAPLVFSHHPHKRPEPPETDPLAAFDDEPVPQPT